jgi:hypothetical protein
LLQDEAGVFDRVPNGRVTLFHGRSARSRR